MLTSAVMLEEAALDAGMMIPKNIEWEHDPKLIKEQYPHWFVYCSLQLCRPITWGNHWNNAKIITGIPREQLITMTEEDFRALGFDP